MIPVRVSVRNFLCYGEEPGGQPIEFDFDGSRLWSISGDNGAGKSAIFDAVTYALYSRHRGGAQKDARLIHKGAHECECAFEFQMDGRLYRVRRTVGRTNGKGSAEQKTCQASYYDEEAGEWRPIPETERVAGLEKWVRDNLGLRYETFVASVLLLQGQSDQLILAEPKRRFEILSGMLDMEPYQRLEALARDRAKEAADQAKLRRADLAGLEPVSEDDLSNAARDLESSREALAKAQELATAADLIVGEARRFAELESQFAQAREALAAQEHLLRDEKRIRAAYDEWRSLAAAVPKLRAALEDLAEAVAKEAAQREASAAASGIDLAALARSAAELAKAEKAAETAVRQVRREVDALATALPLLGAVVARRSDLEQREAALATTGTPADVGRRLARAAKLCEQAEGTHAKAGAGQREAMQASADARAKLVEAEEKLCARRAAKGEAVCSHCGQKVSEAHIKKEIADAQAAVGAAKEGVREAAAALAAAERDTKGAALSLKEAQEARREIEISQAAAEQADAERGRAAAELERALASAAGVPAELSSPVVKAAPAEGRLALESLDDRLSTARRRLEDAEDHERRARDSQEAALREQQDAVRRRDALLAEADRFATEAEGRRRQAAVRLADVDPAWRKRGLAADEAFVAGLSGRLNELDGVDDDYRALELASDEAERLRARASETARLLEGFAPEHRVPVTAAAEQAGAARRERDESQTAWSQAQERVRRLEDAKARREKLAKEAEQAEARRGLYTRLSELLGRGGLQGYLMDAALASITDIANETLSKISGGQLRIAVQRQPLRSNGRSAARSDEEIVIQVTDLAFSEEALDVQFISGSQKFRASVALAAAIGQYTGGRGVRSLIIDEGFGSLDTQGRNEMIDELRNLSNLMDRIIVVSHQADFQDRTVFPTGFVLRKDGREARVERFV